MKNFFQFHDSRALTWRFVFFFLYITFYDFSLFLKHESTLPIALHLFIISLSQELRFTNLERVSSPNDKIEPFLSRLSWIFNHGVLFGKLIMEFRSGPIPQLSKDGSLLYSQQLVKEESSYANRLEIWIRVLCYSIINCSLKIESLDMSFYFSI